MTRRLRWAGTWALLLALTAALFLQCARVGDERRCAWLREHQRVSAQTYCEGQR